MHDEPLDLGLIVCASNLVARGLACAQEAKADGDAAKEASRPDDPEKAEITFVIHAHDGVIRTMGWSPLKAEVEALKYSYLKDGRIADRTPESVSGGFA